MKMPRADAGAVAAFGAMVPSRPGVEVRQMFGHPAAFLHGHMFLGVFGDRVFVRLGESDRAEALRSLPTTLFEPMPGRPMTEYVVLPSPVLRDGSAAARWVARSVDYVGALPPKSKGRARTKKK